MAVKTNISLRKLLENKKIAMVISLVIAIVLWLNITITESADAENTISGISVAIPIENTVVDQMGMDIIGDPTVYTASVVVKGEAFAVSNLSAEDILVSASISNVTTSGNYTLDLRATKKSGVRDNFEIISISPRTINVKFDYIDTKQFAVSVQAIGHKAEDGLIAEMPFVSDSNNATLNIKGARTDIEKISKVVAVADVNKTLDSSETFKGALKILDATGKELDQSLFSITTADGLSAPDIQITVPIYKEKVVPIVAQFANAPKSFADKKITHSLSVSSLLISGPPESIDNIKEINLSEIDFRQITGNDQSFETTIIIPEGIKNKDNIETVSVKITGLKKYTIKTFTVNQITVVNNSVSAKLTRKIRNVKIMGPESVLRNIKESDLYASVDLDGIQSGEHTVSANIICNSADNVWQIGEYTASVNIG